MKLSKMEQEVLELGVDFGLPQKSSREEILAEFELLHQTLIKYRPISKEEADACRARLVDIAEVRDRRKVALFHAIEKCYFMRFVFTYIHHYIHRTTNPPHTPCSRTLS